VGVLLLPAMLAAAGLATRPPSPAGPPIGADQWQPRAGDVILTAADDLLGQRIASASGEAAVYSHVGLVVSHGGRLKVIEASPFGSGDVAYAELDAFTRDPKTTALLVLRPTSPLNEARLDREAERLAAARIPFDYELDDRDGSRLYCAELVRNLLGTAGVDLDGVKRTHVHVPLTGDRAVIMPDAFAHVDGLRPIYRRDGS
jgi:hypothetical protein